MGRGLREEERDFPSVKRRAVCVHFQETHVLENWNKRGWTWKEGFAEVLFEDYVRPFGYCMYVGTHNGVFIAYKTSVRVVCVRGPNHETGREFPQT